MKKVRHVNPIELDMIGDAISWLKDARKLLRTAGAPSAAEYVQRALKSVEGAQRHARRLFDAQQRAKPLSPTASDDELANVARNLSGEPVRTRWQAG